MMTAQLIKMIANLHLHVKTTSAKSKVLSFDFWIEIYVSVRSLLHNMFTANEPCTGSMDGDCIFGYACDTLEVPPKCKIPGKLIVI